MNNPEAQNTDALRQEFHDLYGSGRDFEGLTLIDTLVATGVFVGEIVGVEAADAAFAILTRTLGYQFDADADWAETLKDEAFSDAFCWPIGARLHNLNCFAYYGIALNGGATPDERERLLRTEIEAVSAFIAKVPFEAWGISPGDASLTLQRAQGRLALDTGADVEAPTLALLGGVSERRIRNLMAGKDRAFTPVDGRIAASEALGWLSGRPDQYRPSRWREQNTFDDMIEPVEEPVLEAALFVPMAADGSVFHPGLARDGVFIVGRRPETSHKTYDAALESLQKAARPSWRRPTKRGSWTIVDGVRWTRLEREELERLALEA
jgi:hypothetical protein